MRPSTDARRAGLGPARGARAALALAWYLAAPLAAAGLLYRSAPAVATSPLLATSASDLRSGFTIGPAARSRELELRLELGGDRAERLALEIGAVDESQAPERFLVELLPGPQRYRVALGDHPPSRTLAARLRFLGDGSQLVKLESRSVDAGFAAIRQSAGGPPWKRALDVTGGGPFSWGRRRFLGVAALSVGAGLVLWVALVRRALLVLASPRSVKLGLLVTAIAFLGAGAALRRPGGKPILASRASGPGRVAAASRFELGPALQECTAETAAPPYQAEFRELRTAAGRRPALYMHAGAFARFAQVPLPSAAWLTAEVGMDPEVSRPDRGDGVVFQVLAESPCGLSLLGERATDPKQHPEDRRLLPLEVDLAALGAGPATLVLRVESRDQRWDWAHWVAPSIVPGICAEPLESAPER